MLAGLLEFHTSYPKSILMDLRRSAFGWTIETIVNCQTSSLRPRHDLEDLIRWFNSLGCLQRSIKIVGNGVDYRHILFSTHAYITKFNNNQPPAYRYQIRYLKRCIIRYLTNRSCIRSRTVRLFLDAPWGDVFTGIS